MRTVDTAKVSYSVDQVRFYYTFWNMSEHSTASWLHAQSGPWDFRTTWHSNSILGLGVTFYVILYSTFKVLHSCWIESLLNMVFSVFGSWRIHPFQTLRNNRLWTPVPDLLTVVMWLELVIERPNKPIECFLLQHESGKLKMSGRHWYCLLDKAQRSYSTVNLRPFAFVRESRQIWAWFKRSHFTIHTKDNPLSGIFTMAKANGNSIAPYYV